MRIQAQPSKDIGWPIVIVGVATGLVVGLLGIGGGAVTIFGLVVVAGLSQHQAHATSLASMPLIAVVAAPIFGIHGKVDLTVAALLTIGALGGVRIGSRIMSKVEERALGRAFGVLMLVVGLRLIIA